MYRLTLALLIVAALPTTSRADALDGYDLWRRQTIDVCQRLPTLEEIACITVNGGDYPVGGAGPCDFEATLDACLESEAFAELIALGINDFILPAVVPLKGQYAWINWNTATYFNAAGVEKTVRYWHMDANNSDWDDCLKGVLQPLPDRAALAGYLERADEPFWANAHQGGPEVGIYDDGVPYVLVCKQTEDLTCKGGLYTASLANTAEVECNDSGNMQCDRSKNDFPCGCGPNLRWCLPLGTLYDADGSVAAEPNGDGLRLVRQQLLYEAASFVKQVVLAENGIIGGAARFTDIFDGEYGIRTSRLQHFYEVNQADFRDTGDSDACDRIIDGLDKSAASCTTPKMGGQVPFIDRGLGLGAGYALDAEAADWQVIDYTTPAVDGVTPRLDHFSGILSTWELLLRQPSEPNFANRVYSHWTCEEIGWREWGLSDISAGGTGHDWALSGTGWGTSPRFSTLYRTTAALEPFNDPLMAGTCLGCHLTVNSMAAFRNRWDQKARYKPRQQVYAYGAFLGEEGDDLAGLGALMATSPVVHACIVNRTVKRLTGHWMKRTDAELQSLVDVFTSSGFDMRALYRAVIDTDAYRRPR